MHTAVAVVISNLDVTRGVVSLVWLLSALWTLAVVDRRCVHFPVLPGRVLRLNHYFLHLLFTPLGSSRHFTRKKTCTLLKVAHRRVLRTAADFETHFTFWGVVQTIH